MSPKKPKKIIRCGYVHADGHMCGSPALRNQLFCYYHQRDRQRANNLRAYAAKRAEKEQSVSEADIAVLAALNLPTPDNPVATQVCIAGILQAMMSGALSGALGGRLLYGLHLAKCNYRDVSLYNQRYSEPDLPIVAVPIAASDPEPIAPIDDSANAYSGEAIDRYAEGLEVDMRELPSINSEIDEAECAIDSEFSEAIENLSVEDSVKQIYRADLGSPYRSHRQETRKQLLRLLSQELYILRSADREQKQGAREVPPAAREQDGNGLIAVGVTGLESH